MASDTVYRASVRGAGKAGTRLDRAARGIQTVLISEFRDLAPVLTKTARDFAPHKSGALERGLKARVFVSGGRVKVELLSTVRSEEGFPYTRATRFGRKAIRPKKPGGVLTWQSATGRVFAKFARAYKPDSDWVENAEGSWEQDVAAATKQIGRAIDTRLLG